MTFHLSVQEIGQRIYHFRGYPVMLDGDLAVLYETETKVLNQAVRRQISRFHEDFMFQLTVDESDQLVNRKSNLNEKCLRSQFVTLNDRHNLLKSKDFKISDEELPPSRSQILNNKRGKSRKYLPYVFTEQGVSNLSSILNTERAVEVNIAIMRTFVQLRKERATQGSWMDQITLLRTEFDQKFENHTKLILDAIHHNQSTASSISDIPHLPSPQHFQLNKMHATVPAIQNAVANIETQLGMNLTSVRN
jgi:hypothetical protein